MVTRFLTTDQRKASKGPVTTADELTVDIPALNPMHRLTQPVRGIPLFGDVINISLVSGVAQEWEATSSLL